MKLRVLSIATAAVMALSLTACQKKEEAAPAADAAAADAAAEAAAPAAAEAAAAAAPATEAPK